MVMLLALGPGLHWNEHFFYDSVLVRVLISMKRHRDHGSSYEENI